MMNARAYLRIAATALICILALGAPVRAETTRGTWGIATIHGLVQLEMRWHSPDGRNNNDHSAYVDAQALGIAKELASSGQHATFSLHREAGDFAFDGWLGKGEGSGSYTFTPNDAFFDALRRRGYDVRTIDYKLAFANLDITMSYVDQMEQLGYKGDTNNLVAMKALGVTPDYVHQLQSAGITDLTEANIISLRAVGVTKAYVDEIASAGFAALAANQYITLRAMKVDAAYIKYLRGHGFKNLTVDQVVTMKAERI